MDTFFVDSTCAPHHAMSSCVFGREEWAVLNHCQLRSEASELRLRFHRCVCWFLSLESIRSSVVYISGYSTDNAVTSAECVPTIEESEVRFPWNDSNVSWTNRTMPWTSWVSWIAWTTPVAWTLQITNVPANDAWTSRISGVTWTANVTWTSRITGTNITSAIPDDSFEYLSRARSLSTTEV